ncbi:MAG: NAD-dependent epimerase/dehydratase family protein [Streptosporangiales bacterium]|nr:NAD-dependent epimerase/dehydratase family protein [Streptosporangiales bacterium]
MRVLVTGAAGFIGSHLVDRLLADGHQVIGVDNLSTGDPDNLTPALAQAGECGAFALHQLDVTDPALGDVVREHRVEVVCHLAAQISVQRSVTDPANDARVNVLGTVNLLEAARRGGVRKVVFASSVAVYGIPAALPVVADASAAPRSPYAASKRCGEVYLEAYRALYGFDVTTLTLANVYGPRQSAAGESGVVAIFVDALLGGKPTRIFGRGDQTRDYVYVEDVVDAFRLACGDRGGGERFNIGTGVATSDRELHSLVAEITGAPDTPEYAPPRPGDLPAMVIDPAPARTGLGWSPRTPLREGIAATVAWTTGG